MNQKKKKPLLPTQETALLDDPRNRQLFLRAALALYSAGFALSVWGNLRFGASLGQALGRSLITLAVVLAVQLPLYLWYRKRMKVAPSTKN